MPRCRLLHGVGGVAVGCDICGGLKPVRCGYGYGCRGRIDRGEEFLGAGRAVSEQVVRSGHLERGGVCPGEAERLACPAGQVAAFRVFDGGELVLDVSDCRPRPAVNSHSAGSRRWRRSAVPLPTPAALTPALGFVYREMVKERSRE